MKNYNHYLVQYCIEEHLKEMFYKIPRVTAVEGMTSDDFKFTMDTADAKCLSGATIKRWINSEFDMTKFSIKASKCKRVGFGGNTDYGYDFFITVSPKEV